MITIRLAIIEDEMLAEERLRSLLESYTGATLDIGFSTDSVAGALKLIPKHSVDLLLCDIQLADGLSFNIWQHLDLNVPVIFTTAYEAYALRAFKVNGIDYLLKPIEAAELHAALDKFVAQQQAAQPVQVPSANLLDEVRLLIQQKRYPKRLLSKVGNKLVPVELNTVSVFRSESRITWAYDHDGNRQAVSETLEELEDLLDPQQFKRVNRASIVAASALEQLTAYSNSRYRAHLTGYTGEPIIIARERVAEVKQWLAG